LFATLPEKNIPLSAQVQTFEELLANWAYTKYSDEEYPKNFVKSMKTIDFVQDLP